MVLFSLLGVVDRDHECKTFDVGSDVICSVIIVVYDGL